MYNYKNILISLVTNSCRSMPMALPSVLVAILKEIQIENTNWVCFLVEKSRRIKTKLKNLAD